MHDRPYPIKNPFLHYLGAKFVAGDKNGCHLSLNILPHLTNSWGKGHGGMLVTLMDVAMSWAARFYVDNLFSAVTVEIKTSFFEAAIDKIDCYAKVLHKTTSMAFCEAYIQNQNDKIICKSSATFKYLNKLST
jgi:uncharacterized protein (TIGR00369 family)